MARLQCDSCHTKEPLNVSSSRNKRNATAPPLDPSLDGKTIPIERTFSCIIHWSSKHNILDSTITYNHQSTVFFDCQHMLHLERFTTMRTFYDIIINMNHYRFHYITTTSATSHDLHISPRATWMFSPPGRWDGSHLHGGRQQRHVGQEVGVITDPQQKVAYTLWLS